MSARITKRRVAYRLVIAAFWLIALGLLLELHATAARWQVERNNPFIQAAAGKSDAKKATGTPPPAETAIACLDSPAALLPEASSAAANIRDWEHPPAIEVAVGVEKRRARFPELDEPDRLLFALINREFVAVFTPEAKVEAAYQSRAMLTQFLNRFLEHRDPFLSPVWDQVSAAVREAFEKNEARYATITLQTPSGSELQFKTHFMPAEARAGGARRIYAFARIEVEYFRELLAPLLSPESPWDVPFMRYKSNLRDAHTSDGATLSRNNFGFRGRDILSPKPEGVFRILCIGASTTEEGDTDETTYPAILEKQLQAAFPGRQIEVVNCGVPGLTTNGHLLRRPEYQRIEPDLYLLYLGINDTLTDYLSEPVPLPIPWWKRPLRHSRFLCDHINAFLQPAPEQIRTDLAELTLTNLDAFYCAARGDGIPVVLCTFAAPDLQRLNRAEQQYFDYDIHTHWLCPRLDFASYKDALDILNEEIRDFCAKRKLLCIPVAENIEGGTYYFRDACHMKAPGIERKAAIIAKCLRGPLAQRFQER